MKMALSELIIQGITHNRNLHLDILSDKEFVDGTYTTGFMEDFDKRRNKQKDESNLLKANYNISTSLWVL